MSPHPAEPPPPRPAQRAAQGLAKISLALRTRQREQAAGQGLSPTQGQVLSALLAAGRRAARLGELAKQLAITPATASDAVAALLSKRLARKVRSRADGRAVEISLTPAGRREAGRAAEWPDFLAAAVDSLSDSEQGTLLRVLSKAIRELQEHGQIQPARMCVNCTFFRPNVYPGSERPHHCGFVDAPFGDRELRLDCPDHAPALTAIRF
ncbi:MAG: winged helix-turn-helix transcriptional regulator [Acidobacteria bacterium]|nr:winged helix-turn-helix transcriptional regulator [Acidobacteriota bacterium]